MIIMEDFLKKAESNEKIVIYKMKGDEYRNACRGTVSENTYHIADEE